MGPAEVCRLSQTNHLHANPIDILERSGNKTVVDVRGISDNGRSDNPNWRIPHPGSMYGQSIGRGHNPSNIIVCDTSLPPASKSDYVVLHDRDFSYNVCLQRGSHDKTRPVARCSGSVAMSESLQQDCDGICNDPSHWGQPDSDEIICLCDQDCSDQTRIDAHRDPVQLGCMDEEVVLMYMDTSDFNQPMKGVSDICPSIQMCLQANQLNVVCVGYDQQSERIPDAHLSGCKIVNLDTLQGISEVSSQQVTCNASSNSICQDYREETKSVEYLLCPGENMLDHSGPSTLDSMLPDRFLCGDGTVSLLGCPRVC